MQIYEITNCRRMQEAFAPGGVVKQTGSFLGGVGQNLAKAMIPAGGNTDAAPGASVAPGQAGGAAAAASAPAVAALAKTLQAQWSDTVTQMMQQAKNPATGRAGVQSIKDIQPIEIERALVELINTNLQRMSGRAVSDYKNAASQVDQDANQGQLRNMVGDMSANIDKAIDAMLITEPTRTNANKLADLWGSIAKMSYGIANEVEFNPVSGKAAANTNATTDPNAADPQLAQAAQRAGLTAQQLRITTKVPQQRDPAVNKVLASMGLLQGAPQQQQKQMAVAEAKK
jgi:hypothetical protein